MAFWSFKPFEFEQWCGDYLIKDSHDFITKINAYSKDKNTQTIVFIDEFMDFISTISEEEKNILIDLFKYSKENNMCFICCSQNINLALSEFGEYISTKICMMCSSKEQSEIIIGKDYAGVIDKCGIMYVLNSRTNKFAHPKLLNVIKDNTAKDYEHYNGLNN